MEVLGGGERPAVVVCQGSRDARSTGELKLEPGFNLNVNGQAALQLRGRSRAGAEEERPTMPTVADVGRLAPGHEQSAMTAPEWPVVLMIGRRARGPPGRPRGNRRCCPCEQREVGNTSRNAVR